MSFETESCKSGKQATSIVELYLDRCQLRYSEAQCSAAISLDTPTQCFNTIKTCQDRVNYQRNAVPITLHSEDLGNAWWTPSNITITADTEPGPDRGQIADTFEEVAAIGVHSISRTDSIVVSGRVVTVATWFKRLNGSRNVGILITDSSGIFGGDVEIIIDPSTGLLVDITNAESYRVEDSKSGWWRVSITTPIASGDGVTTIEPARMYDGTSGSYLGDITETILAFGAIAFLGEYATGYGTQDDVIVPFNNPMRVRCSTSPIDKMQLAKEPPVMPHMIAVDTAPTILTPGAGIGVRASASITLQDSPFSDIVLDPYVGQRPTPINWNDGQHGTWLARLLARNTNFENRRVDILTGFMNDQGTYVADNFNRRTYILDAISGPGTNGVVNITAKDPLKLADSTRRTCPRASTATLQTEMDFNTVVIEVGDSNGTMLSNWNDGQVYILIDGEILSMAGAPTPIGGGLVSITVNRGVSPSYYENDLNDRREHKIGVTVQPCYEFSDTRIDDIAYILLHDFAEIADEFLPTDEWDLEIDLGGLINYDFSCLITKPTGVGELLSEISKHNLMIWWDERQRAVRIRAVSFVSLEISPQYTDQDNIQAGTVSTSMDMRRRISQVWLYSAHRFPTKELRPEFFGALRLDADLERETPEEYGSPRLAVIGSRWLRNTDSSVAIEVASRYLRNYRDGKRITVCRVDAKDFDLWTGDKVRIVTSAVLDELGQPVDFNALITQVDEIWGPDGLFYELTTEQESTLTRFGVIAPNGMPDYSLASEAQKLRYLFIGPNVGNFPDGTPPYTIS